MPQMSPLFWLILMLSFVLVYFILLLVLYFNHPISMMAASGGAGKCLSIKF